MRVAVVGMGFAGLACARDLHAAGIEVLGIEARSEVGGRVRNLALADGSVEMGGEWVDADHRRVLALADSQGRRLLPASPLPQALHYGGDLVLESDWPEVADEEAGFDEEARRLATAYDALSEAEAERLDRLPLAEFVRAHVRGERARWLVEARLRSDEGEELSRVSTLGWLSGWRNYLARDGNEMSAIRIEGGLAGLARGLADDLPDVRLGTPVRGIERVARVVRINGFGDFDRVVLALPPPLLRRISGVEAAPLLPIARAVKIVMRYERAFWLERGLSGRVLSDGPLAQLWAGPDPGAPNLSAYIVGDAAERWSRLADPVAAAAQAVRRIFAEAPEPIAGASLDWAAEPFAGGAFPYVPVGGGRARSPRRAGPIHFAGDWCAGWMGFVEGALESGERAAREILEG